MAYSGFTNLATYQVHMWMGQMFDGDAEDGVDITADYVREVTTEYVYEQLGGRDMLPSGLVSDIIGCALGSVDWEELAEHYQVQE